MNSCLYKCKVTHDRAKPKRHRFEYACFLFCIDLDEIDILDRKLPLFGYNRRAAYALRDSDHLDQGQSGIKKNVVAYLRERGVESALGRIRLVTNLRTWGHVFNPVSFYFVDDSDGRPLCVVAEVANTFHEQKLYLVEQRSRSGASFQQSHQKLFYISPFSRPDTCLNFKFQDPADRINLSITESDADGVYFFSGVQGKRQPLSNRSLALCTLRFPLMTVQVVAAIHWQALRLYLKKVPFFRKNFRTDLQTDTRAYLRKTNRSA